VRRCRRPVIDTGADPADRAAFTDLFRPLTEPDAVARGHELNARLDELADADPDDPRVAAVAGDLAAHIPDEMATVMVTSLDGTETGHWLEAMSRELSAAQAEVFRLLVITLKERECR